MSELARGEIWATTMVLPRMEWPFLADWAGHLAEQGVDRLWLGVDWEKTQGFVWEKKPHPEIFWPQLDDSAIRREWAESLRRAGECLEVREEEVPPLSGRFGHSRRQLGWLRKVDRLARAGDVNWLLHLDPDEFPESMEQSTVRAVLETLPAETVVVLMQQYLCGSRWDFEEGGAPRERAEIGEFHPEPLMLPKYAFRPGCARRLQVHEAVAMPGCVALTAEVQTLFFRHYRGIEKAYDPVLQAVTRLDGIWAG